MLEFLLQHLAITLVAAFLHLLLYPSPIQLESLLLTHFLTVLLRKSRSICFTDRCLRCQALLLLD